MAYVIADKPAGFDPFAKQRKKEKTYYVSDTPVDFDPFSQSRTKTQEMAPQSTTGQGTIQNQPIEQQTQPTQELKPTEPRNAVDVPPPAVARALSGRSQEDDRAEREKRIEAVPEDPIDTEMKRLLEQSKASLALAKDPYAVVRAVEEADKKAETERRAELEAVLDPDTMRVVDVSKKADEIRSRGLLRMNIIPAVTTTQEPPQAGKFDKTIKQEVTQPEIKKIWDAVDQKKAQIDKSYEEDFSTYVQTRNPVTGMSYNNELNRRVEELNRKKFTADLEGLVQESQVLLAAGIKPDTGTSWRKLTKGREFAELVPFSPAGFGKLLEVNYIAGKLKRGESLSSYEEARINEFTADKTLRAEIGQTVGSGIFDGVLNMIPYAVEFAATWGAASGVRAAAVGGAKKVLGTKLAAKVGEKAILREGGKLLLGGSVAATTRVLLTPDELAEGALDRKLNQVRFDGVSSYVDLSVPARSWASALLNSFGERFAEMAGEAAGETIVKTIPKALWNSMGEKTREKLAATVLYRVWSKTHPKMNSSAFVQTMNKLGKQGLGEEWTEERYSAALRELMGVDKDQRGDSTLMDRLFYDSWEDALIEAGILTVGGGPATVGNAVSSLQQRARASRYEQATELAATELAAADRAAREAMRPQNAQMTQTDRGIVPNRPEIVAQDNAPRSAGGEKKPKELMTAAEFEADRKRQQKELGHGEHIPGTISAKKSIAVESSYGPLKRALEDGRPVNADLFDVHNSNPDNRPVLLPDGYVREGDTYVRKVETQPISEQAPANTTTTPVKANEKKTVEPVRSSTITLQNKAGKTRTVDVVKETDTAFLYRDEDGTQRRLMKTAWTKQTEQQVTKNNSKVEIDKEKEHKNADGSVYVVRRIREDGSEVKTFVQTTSGLRVGDTYDTGLAVKVIAFEKDTGDTAPEGNFYTDREYVKEITEKNEIIVGIRRATDAELDKLRRDFELILNEDGVDAVDPAEAAALGYVREGDTYVKKSSVTQKEQTQPVSGGGIAKLGDRVEQNKAQQATELAAADRSDLLVRPMTLPENSKHYYRSEGDNPRGSGFLPLTKSLSVASSYERGGYYGSEEEFEKAFESGEIEASEARVKLYEARIENLLDTTEPSGRDVLANLDDKGDAMAAQIIRAAKRGDLFWFETKQPYLNAWNTIIIPQLKNLGYDSIRYADDPATGVATAVFDRSQLKEVMPPTKERTPQTTAVEPARSSIGSLSHKVGDIVTWREPAIVYEGGNPITIQAKKAGTIKEILPDGRYNIKRQDGGYQKATDSDFLPKLSGSNTQTKITAGEQAQRPETEMPDNAQSSSTEPIQYGMRRSTSEWDAHIETLRKKAREIINRKYDNPAQKADDLASAKEAIDQAVADAHSNKQVPTLSEQAQDNTTNQSIAANKKKNVEPVRSSTITLQNKAGKTRTVDVVKETDTAFLYRDEDGTQRRLMKTAWTKQTEQQVAKTNSKVEIAKEKNESTSNESIKTNQTKDVPLSGSESPQSYRQRSEETIRKEIETNGLGVEFENFLARLESAKETARYGSYGLQAQKDDQGYITGWYNQGRIYPEGFDAKSIPAIRNFIRGKRPLTQNQLDVVERAYELIEAEIGIKLEVVKNFKEDIKKGERPPQEVIDENPFEWEIAITESGINEDDLGDTSFDFGFNAVDKNEDAQVDSLKEWRKNHGIAEPDEQVEMFGKGAVGDVFELQSQVVKERESFSEKKAREEKQAKAEAAQTNMFEPSPEQAINQQETIEQSAPKGKESKLSFLDKTQNKPRGVSSGNALGTGGGAGIDTFKPDVEQHGQKEVKLYERSKELIKKHGGNRKIMEGRNPSGTLGVSYNHSGNIALAALNNIGVAAHETTHNVDRKIRFTERITRTVGTTKDGKPKYDPATIKERKELTEVYTEFYPNGNATHSLKKRVTEGFATFVQKYIEDPTTMSKRFPELKNMILDPSGKYYSPEVEALIKDARAIVNDYHKLDPLQKIGARILQEKSKDGKPFLNFKDKVETIVADQVWPLEKVSKEAGVHFTEEDVSLYARSYDYLSSIIAHNLKKNAFGAESFMTFKDGKFVEIYDFNYRTLIHGLDKTGLDKTFDEYLVARRKVADYKKLDTLKDEMDKASKSVKNAVNIAKEMGIKPKEVVVGDKSMADLVNEFKKAKKEHDNHKSIIDKDNLSRDLVQQAVNLSNNTIPDIKTYEEMHDKLTRADLDLLKEVGIISSKDYNDYVSEPGYASFKRDMFNDLIDPKTGKTTSVANLSGGSVSSLKRRTGSERTIISPTANAVANHAEIMRKAFRQATLNKLADLADKVPDLMQKEKLRRIYDPDTGRTIYPQENDPNIIMARRNGERIPYVINKEIKTVLDRILTPESVDIGEKIGAAFSRLFTKGTTGLWIAFAGQNVMVDSLAASAQSRTEYVPIVSQLKLIYKAIRGNSSKEAEFLREYMIIVGARQTATGWNELPPDKLKQVISKEVSALGIVAKAYFLGEKILGAPTQASEILTRATEYINSRVNGDSQFVAMEKAGRVSAPFHHHGSYGGHRSIRALVRGTPYLNSGIQAPKEYWKALLDPKRVNRALLVTSLVVGAKILELVPMMIAATDDQKKKLKDIPTKYAARYIFIPHPNGIDLIKVRIPENMGTIGTLINMELQNRMMENDYSASEFVDAGTAWVPDQFNITSPRRIALSWITGFQATKPLVENILNKKTWPDVRDLESIGVSYDRPEDRIYRNTSELAKNISKMKVLGKSIGERTGLSPIKVDNLIEGYFARIATLFTKPSMAIRKNITPFEMEVYFTAGRSVQDFYDQADAVTQMRNAISDGKEKVTPEQARIIESDYQKVLSVKRGLKEYNDLGDERTKEAEILRAKIIDTMDSLGTGDEYKEYFPTKKSFKPKLIEPYSTKEKTPFDTDRKSSREPTPFDNR